ncbi:hypothetical protein [Macrococcoides caseolyticum]|uniref:hypothetical protein n=1 Tax=Macrococcoides caseolyticum TaxID=69966 RepID=UPI001F2C9CC2|nr:hypothetical protein [Macrococcus caseolyticus]MCE4956044.1 hypothetical protein [Macrococcus caseolyticus]
MTILFLLLDLNIHSDKLSSIKNKMNISNFKNHFYRIKKYIISILNFKNDYVQLTILVCTLLYFLPTSFAIINLLGTMILIFSLIQIAFSLINRFETKDISVDTFMQYSLKYFLLNYLTLILTYIGLAYFISSINKSQNNIYSCIFVLSIILFTYAYISKSLPIHRKNWINIIQFFLNTFAHLCILYFFIGLFSIYFESNDIKSIRDYDNQKLNVPLAKDDYFKYFLLIIYKGLIFLKNAPEICIQNNKTCNNIVAFDEIALYLCSLTFTTILISLMINNINFNKQKYKAN